MVFLFSLSMICFSQTGGIITFETIPGDSPVEGLVIHDQFKKTHGVTFEYASGGHPQLAEVGPPRTAFAGPPDDAGDDTVVPNNNIYRFFLTDDQTIGTSTDELIVSYDTPVSGAGAVIMDIDGHATGQSGWEEGVDEAWAVMAYDRDGTLLRTVTLIAGDPQTGDGMITPWSISFDEPVIKEIRIKYVGIKPLANVGFAMDNFLPSTPFPDFEILQITDRTGGPCSGCCGIHHRQPVLDPFAPIFAFSSIWNKDQVSGNLNPERNAEIWKYSIEEGIFIQDTITTEGISLTYDMASTKTLFISCSPDLGENIDANTEVFLYHDDSGQVIQISDTVSTPPVYMGTKCPLPWFEPEDWRTLSAIHPDISSGTRFLVWSSNRNIPLGLEGIGNNADHNYEIFWKDIQTGEIKQITDTEGGDEPPWFAANMWPRVSIDGEKIVFASNRILDGGEIPDGKYVLYLADLSGDIKRIGKSAISMEREFPGFDIDANFERIVFASEDNPLNENTDRNSEIFSFKVKSETINQVTVTTAPLCNRRPILSGDGLKMAFQSNADFFVWNNDGSEELWMYHFDDDAKYPHPFIQVTMQDDTPSSGPGRISWMDWYDLNHDGARLVFCSNSDPVGENLEANYEIFLVNFDWEQPPVRIGRIYDYILKRILLSPDDLGIFDLNHDGVIDVSDGLFLVVNPTPTATPTPEPTPFPTPKPDCGSSAMYARDFDPVKTGAIQALIPLLLGLVAIGGNLVFRKKE